MLEAFCNLHCFALFFLSQVSLSKQWFYDFEPTWVEQPDRTYHKRFGIPASGPISSVSQFQRSVVGASHSISWQLLWKSFVLISGIYNLDNYASHSTLIGTWSIWLVFWIFFLLQITCTNLKCHWYQIFLRMRCWHMMPCRQWIVWFWSFFYQNDGYENRNHLLIMFMKGP